jgi:corrinoid protein of di/trimethylamine methyltransferase
MSKDHLSNITKSIVEGDTAAAVDLTRQGLDEGVAPLVMINEGLVPGMDIAGDKFARGEYFLPHLLMAGKAMQMAMELLEPELIARDEQVERLGTVVIGTVHGDIHEIGKSLVATMLSANGFEVHDLGVDVPAEKFIEKVKETGANVLGLSALLTTTMVVQREIIEGLIEADLRSQVKVLVGGAPVSRDWAEEIGADGYAEDALDAVQVAKYVLGLEVDA